MSKRTMTAEQAKEFSTYSARNAAIVAMAFEQCGCSAYEDVFTFARWKAQGYQVRKGEHGVKISTYAPITRKDPETGADAVVGTRPWTSTVFCRCQVDATGESKPASSGTRRVRRESKPAPAAAIKPNRKPEVMTAVEFLGIA